MALNDDQEARLSMEAFDKTMEHFDYPAEKREQMGNVIMRFAMMLSIQPEGKRFSVDPKDAAMNTIVDVYEHYNRLLDAALDEKWPAPG